MWISSGDFWRLIREFFPVGNRPRDITEMCADGTIKSKARMNRERTTYWISAFDVGTILRSAPFELEEDEIAMIQGRTRVNFNRLELVS